MNRFFLYLILFVIFSINLQSQFNSNGYDAKRKCWNINIQDLNYGWYQNNPNQIRYIILNIENNTSFNIDAIDIEIVLKNNGHTFFKNKLKFTFYNTLHPSDIEDSDEFYFHGTISRYLFDKKFTWSAKIINIYGENTNNSQNSKKKIKGIFKGPLDFDD